MGINETAYRYALSQNKGKTFSMAEPDECFRYFLSCYLSRLPERETIEERGCSHCACLRCQLLRNGNEIEDAGSK